uniref:Uncharacterized protein n=1 Tax=Chenopodium quinoa TaxID=63459 RepID=A0A803MC66_CHEQI
MRWSVGAWASPERVRKAGGVGGGRCRVRLRLETVKLHFEALAKVDGDKVLLEDTMAPSVLQGNVTMSKIPVMYQPSNPFTII